MADDIAEEWRVVPGCAPYEVSNTGKVRRGPGGRVLKPGLDSHGYHRVVMTFGAADRRNAQVSRLVASAFIENPENLPCVDHMNRNPLDNRVANLRWTTQGKNCRNRTPKRGEGNFNGLFFLPGEKKWQVAISKDGAFVFKKNFDDFARALEARNEQKRLHHGEYAYDIRIEDIDLDSLPKATPFKRQRSPNPDPAGDPPRTERPPRDRQNEKLKRSEKVLCECGAQVSRGYLSKHKESAAHRKQAHP